MYVRTITFESPDIGILYLHNAHPIYLQAVQVKFEYEGHPVKVTGAKKLKIPVPAM